MNRVAVHPEVLAWALERSRKDSGQLRSRWKKIDEWLTGEAQPTLKQLEDFASVTATPLGYLFLPEPPDEPLPIPDFRTLRNGAVARPSADLLETIQTMQRRRDWLRELLVEEEAEPLGFVGSARLGDSPEGVGQEMRRIVGLEDGWGKRARTWTEAVSELRRSVESLGVIAVINGVVGNNTHRRLDVGEFRGFALCDDYAPVIFVNGADFKCAQMFTLGHELAHIWLGREGVSGFEGIVAAGDEVEEFCDAAAAEFLVPARELRSLWREAQRKERPFDVAARQFKVSPIVAARRAWDLQLIGRDRFFGFYENYMAEERWRKRDKESGGDFYNNQNTRVGERFAAEVIRAAKEGRIGYREAYSLTGLYGSTFKRYVQHIGFDLL